MKIWSIIFQNGKESNLPQETFMCIFHLLSTEGKNNQVEKQIPTATQSSKTESLIAINFSSWAILWHGWVRNLFEFQFSEPVKARDQILLK